MRCVPVFAVASALWVFTCGCPFESEVPIGDPTPGSLDSRLLGDWCARDSAGGCTSLYKVFRFNSSEYYVEDVKADGTYRLRMYVVPVGDQQFLCMSELNDRNDKSPDAFMFARYSVSDDGVLSIRMVDESAIPASAATGRKPLLAFLKAHLQGTVLDDPSGPILLHRSARGDGPK